MAVTTLLPHPWRPGRLRGDLHEARALLSLIDTARKHDEAITAHVDRLPALADLIAEGSLDAVRDPLEHEYAFIVGQVAPHIDAVESTLYPPLEMLMGCCHSMLGMRREHRELAELIDRLGQYRAALDEDRLTPSDQTGLRRALCRLHAVLKVHLTEEARYMTVLECNLSDEEKEVLARGLDHRMTEPL